MVEETQKETLEKKKALENALTSIERRFGKGSIMPLKRAEKVLDIRGRGRKKQIALAQKYGLEYEQPAGGCCYLTDENYAYRFKEALHK